MGSTGRRRQFRRRGPSDEPASRPPFGAPRAHWWGDQSAQEWWLSHPAQHRLIDEPAKYGFLDEAAPHRPDGRPDGLARPAEHSRLAEHGRPAQHGRPGGRAPYGGGEPTQFLDERARQRRPGPPDQGRPPGDPARRRWPDPAAWHRWLDAATRHPWLTAFGAGAGFIVLAGGILLVLPKQPPSAMMTDCGTMPCVTRAATHAGTGMASSQAAPGRMQPEKPRATMSPMAAPSTLPAAAASAAPQLPPSVTVSYALIVTWSGGLMGEFTVANHGATELAGWELSAAFPGDQIQVTWGPLTSDADHDRVLMAAQPDWPSIAPGTSQSGYFIARGTMTAPSTCTFDGAACFGAPSQS